MRHWLSVLHIKLKDDYQLIKYNCDFKNQDYFELESIRENEKLKRGK